MRRGDSEQTLSKFPGSGANIGRMDGSETTPTRVLVVDDERNITDLVTMALRYEGFAVESASDRDSQLVRLRPGRPTP